MVIVARRQEKPKPALIVGFEGGHDPFLLFDDEFSVRERARIGNALSRGSPMNWTGRDHAFNPGVRLGFRRGRWLRQADAGKNGKRHHDDWDKMELAHDKQ